MLFGVPLSDPPKETTDSPTSLPPAATTVDSSSLSLLFSWPLRMPWFPRTGERRAVSCGSFRMTWCRTKWKIEEMTSLWQP